MSFSLRHVISMKDFTREDIDEIFELAERLERVASGVPCRLLEDKLLALLFYEPSTRTRLSFDAAMKRLGGASIDLGSVEASSVAKGETLADTIRVVGGYADAIVLRHPSEGAARMASEYSRVPVVNAGDGVGHHPTQTLLDLYTIKRENRLDGISVALVGDLRYGRTVHSLAYALALYGVRIYLVSPPQLRMPEHIKSDLLESNIVVEETSRLEDVFESVNVLYMTRIQRERFAEPSEYLAVAGSYRLTSEMLSGVRDDLIIMHPLPRVGEIDSSVDETPYARYFKQSFYGVPVRMALLVKLLEGRDLV
ncbi:aspartate carbamoyltransferase [Methanosarcinales archaeon ex4484_138]|nr:MAG: aspartate carbamoyltransferase [Methanosarcinales archaeon ex4484_138]RLG26916.1 MAG: aspartate carbamoyltransferase [Methanosarcinales archaeon]RLG27332.1 MAG: aspartate carbamoyltransferase [Methanosarcinales archaeon]